MLYAFDLLELDGVDYRPLPLGKRKEQLACLVDRRLIGIAMNDHTDTSGELVFQQACRMGLEGIVAMRAKIKAGGHASPYRLRKQLPPRRPPAAPSMLEINNGGTFWTVW